MINEYKLGKCSLCERDSVEITAHHLIPKTTHTNKYSKKNFTTSEMSKTVDLCRSCHKMVHATFDEKELARSYNTIELLKKSDVVYNFIKWIQKQPSDKKVKINWTNDRRRKNG